MKSDEWNRYARKALKRAEEDLAKHDRAVAEHGLRVYQRTLEGEREITAESRAHLVRVVEEYRSLLRED